MVKVTFSNSGIGTYGVPVCFTLNNDTAKREFDIIRVMVCILAWTLLNCVENIFEVVVLRLLDWYMIMTVGTKISV